MLDDLTKTFFDTFGIESKMGCTAYEELGEAKADLICNDYCPECDYFKEVYPQISDKQYLELICVFNKELIKRFDVKGSDLESLKSNILSKCIKDYTFYSNTLCETYNREAKNFKHQVQAIFKGE